MPRRLEEDIAQDHILDIVTLALLVMTCLLGAVLGQHVQQLSLTHKEGLEGLVVAILLLLKHPPGLELEVSHKRLATIADQGLSEEVFVFPGAKKTSRLG